MIPYIEIMQKFNKKEKLKIVNEYLTEASIKNESDFKVHKCWLEFTPGYKEIFYYKINKWVCNYVSTTSWSESRNLRDQFVSENLEPEDYYSYCAKYNRQIFNYQMINKILQNQANIETKLNKIMDKLEINE